jgi:3-oxoacyl-[acyl-carrier protein] reductase
MEIGFAGKTVIVTGVVGGIGRRIAQDFAKRGAHVHVLDLYADPLREAIDSLAVGGNGGGDFSPLQVDVADATAVDRAVKNIVKDAPHGQVDIVVHAAGGVRGQVAKPIENVTDAEWQSIFEANVTGLFNLVRAAVPGMKQTQKGRIISIASRAGLAVSLTGIQSYAMSKSGQIGLVRQLAHELGRFGITVNAVAPGFMRTNPDAEAQWRSYGEDGQRAMVERTAMRRLGKPEDISNAVMFFASDYADWVTGQTLAVTGSP